METIEREISLIFLRNKILSFDTEEPYVWQSGMIAPVYCDHRELLFLPQERERVIKIFVGAIKQTWPDVEVIAGVATAGIPWAILVADRLKLPLIYIRKERKDHGKERRIEGRLPTKGQNIGLIEDLVSTGESLINAALAIREEAGSEVRGGVIFTYELSDSWEGFARENLEVFSLSNITTLLEVALEEGFITESGVEIIGQWRDDPWGWANKMGFKLKH